MCLGACVFVCVLGLVYLWGIAMGKLAALSPHRALLAEVCLGLVSCAFWMACRAWHHPGPQRDAVMVSSLPTQSCCRGHIV